MNGVTDESGYRWRLLGRDRGSLLKVSRGFGAYAGGIGGVKPLGSRWEVSPMWPYISADNSSNMNGLNENDLNDVIIGQTPGSQVNEENAKKDEENADQLGANSTDSTAQSNHGDTAQATGQAAHGVTVGERGEDEGEQEPAPKSAPDQHGAKDADSDNDEDMNKAPMLPADIQTRTSGQIYHVLMEQFQASPESAQLNCQTLTALLFQKAYQDAIQPGQAKQRENQLPKLSKAENELMVELIKAVVTIRKYTFQRVVGLMKEIALKTHNAFELCASSPTISQRQQGRPQQRNGVSLPG
jgi:hypothetical protein